MILEPLITEKHALLKGALDEQARRLWAGAEAKVLGRSGVSAVARATGMARSTVARGVRDLDSARQAKVTEQGAVASQRVAPRIRRVGGGRKKATEQQSGLIAALEALVSPSSRGDPMNPLRWTCKSVRKLAAELKTQGFKTSHRMVAQMLHDLDYSLKANVKT